jgi:hypothetical protein
MIKTVACPHDKRWIRSDWGFFVVVLFCWCGTSRICNDLFQQILVGPLVISRSNLYMFEEYSYGLVFIDIPHAITCKMLPWSPQKSRYRWATRYINDWISHLWTAGLSFASDVSLKIPIALSAISEVNRECFYILTEIVSHLSFENCRVKKWDVYRIAHRYVFFLAECDFRIFASCSMEAFWEWTMIHETKRMSNETRSVIGAWHD